MPDSPVPPIPSLASGVATVPTVGLDTRALQFDAAEQERDALLGGTRVGRYLVLNRVGAGGAGVVYAAYDPELDRRVALKLLRANEGHSGEPNGAGREPRMGSGPRGPSTSQARLLREAQAMAKLAHPNVTTVHDVGVFGDLVFIAMELVEGGTLRDRLKASPPPSRAERLRLLLEAGDGLAAAHDAGLVHRDFKPDNVLVGADGRARVTDFGLVRAAPTAAGTAPSSERAPPSGPTSARSFDDSLTRVGAVVGTVYYMAPEQHDALATDARTDIYSYCVTVWEALYGERPFAGTIAEVAQRKKARALPEPPAGTSVPAWLRRILERGLSPDPSQRFADMRSLLAALRDDPAARTRRWLGVAAAVLAAITISGASFGLARRSHADRCGGADKLVAGAWDDGVRARLRASFAAALPGSEPIAASVERALDGYVAGWVKMRTDSCAATRVREEQPESVLVLRTACLDASLRELRALTTQLATADKKLVRRAPRAASELPSLASCADVAALTAVAPPPTDPAALALVKVGEQALSEAHVLNHLGKEKEAADRAAEALTSAVDAHYAPLEARVRNERGTVLTSLGDHKEAEPELLTAFSLALRVKDDELATKAATNLVTLETYTLARPAEGLKWAEIAHGVLARSGSPEELRAALLAAEAWAHYEQGDGKTATALAEEALAIAERLYGKDSLRAATFLNGLGAAYHKDKRYADARQTHMRALAICRRELGEDHPYVPASLTNIAEVDVELGDFADARTRLEQALAIYTRIRGPNDPDTALALASLGDALTGLGACADALPKYERAVAINDEKFGKDYPDTAHFLTGLGNCRVQTGDLAGALVAHERAYALVKGPDADPEQAAESRFGLARALVRKDAGSKRARDLAKEAEALFEKAGTAKKRDEVTGWIAEHP